MAENEDDMAIALRRRRFTLDEYHRMGETGILGEDDRVELIEGEIIEMTPIGSPHASTVARIQHLLADPPPRSGYRWSSKSVAPGPVPVRAGARRDAARAPV